MKANKCDSCVHNGVCFKGKMYKQFYSILAAVESDVKVGDRVSFDPISKLPSISSKYPKPSDELLKLKFGVSLECGDYKKRGEED